MKKVNVKLKTGVEIIQTYRKQVTTINVPGETPEPFRWNVQEYENKKKLEKEAEQRKEIFFQDRIKELSERENWRILNCTN